MYDAEAFATWRGSLDGFTYRLPTHHEWEKAAAWDSTESHYYLYGFHRDTIDCPWCNCNNCVGEPMPIGSYDGTGGRENAKSFYGCYDMSGNVWEWTSEVSGSDRLVRGGAWGNIPDDCRCTHQSPYPPAYRDEHVGIRLAREFQ